MSREGRNGEKETGKVRGTQWTEYIKQTRMKGNEMERRKYEKLQSEMYFYWIFSLSVP